MYEKPQPPVKGDLRYEVQPIFKKKKFELDLVRHDRTLQQYDGHEWRGLNRSRTSITRCCRRTDAWRSRWT